MLRTQAPSHLSAAAAATSIDKNGRKAGLTTQRRKEGERERERERERGRKRERERERERERKRER
jgi:hypothetical protein